MDLLIYIVILLITGIVTGFASGLLGVGGGFIMVPVQFWLLTSLGIDPTLAIRIAFGTSLAVILPTAISGAIGHRHRNAVLLKPVIFLSVTGIIGGFIGGFISSNAPGDILKVIFGVVALAAAIRMLFVKYHELEKEKKDSVLQYTFWGFITGITSGLLGIGGGVIMVPIMVTIMRFGIHEAIGTSLTVIIFTSIGGIISYIINGLNVQGLPVYSIGYIDLLQLVILAGTSIPMAQIGVKTAHKLPERKLRYIFIALLVYIALKMIGIF